MTAAPPPPIFVDIESSGITAGAFPIEIGWAQPRVLDNGVVELKVRSCLVRPIDGWTQSPAAWDSAAERVHGLTLDTLLRDGLAVAAVCDTLDEAFAGAEVVTDTSEDGWDDGWMLALYEAAGRHRRTWTVANADSGRVVADHFRRAGLVPRTARPALLRWTPPHTHAAAQDALHYAWQWAMAEILARTNAPRLEPSDLAAALTDLPSFLDRNAWPRIAADSLGRFRRRFE